MVHPSLPRSASVSTDGLWEDSALESGSQARGWLELRGTPRGRHGSASATVNVAQASRVEPSAEVTRTPKPPRRSTE